MKIAVFGANGGIGRLAVRQIVDAGDDAVAIVRRPSAQPSETGAETVVVDDFARGDLLDTALVDTDGVLCAIGPKSPRDKLVATRAVAAILASMKRTGRRRLIAVSASPVGGAPDGEGLLGRLVLYPLANALLRNTYDDLAAMEAAMWASGLACTSIRPPRLTDGPLTGSYRVRVGGSVPNGLIISRADVAHAMRAALSLPEQIGRPVGVAR